MIVTGRGRSRFALERFMRAGYLLGLSSFGWPLVIGGGLNSLYDLLLLLMFRKVRPPEEEVVVDVHSDPPSGEEVCDPSISPTRTRRHLRPHQAVEAEKDQHAAN